MDDLKNNEPVKPASEESERKDGSLTQKIGDELADKAKRELEGLTRQAKHTRNNVLIWLFTTVKGWLVVLSLIVFAVLWIKTGFWVSLCILAVIWIGGWMLVRKYFPKKE